MQKTPPEILTAIIFYLPIDSYLSGVGLAYSRLGSILFGSQAQHIRTQLNLSNQTMYQFLINSELNGKNWLSLPVNYKLGIYMMLFQMPDENSRFYRGDVDEEEDADDIDEELPKELQREENRKFVMEYLSQWPLSTTQAFRLVSASSSLDLSSCHKNLPLRWAEFLLAEASVDPTDVRNAAIKTAYERGNSEVVSSLLRDPRVDPAMGSDGMMMAFENGHKSVVAILLQNLPINEEILSFADYGHLEILDMLLVDGRVDPSADGNRTVRSAAANDRVNVVARLLQDPRVDASGDNNQALANACGVQGNLELVQILLQDERVRRLQPFSLSFIQACKFGRLDIVQVLLAQNPPADPSYNDSMCLQEAVQEGHFEIVELLLQDNRVDAAANNNYCVKVASHLRYTDILMLLLDQPNVDPSVNSDQPIQTASQFGQTEIVALLLQDPRVDPSANGNYAIKRACLKGHTAVVALLLADQRVDPNFGHDLPIRRAAYGGHPAVVDLILADSRFDLEGFSKRLLELAQRHSAVNAVQSLQDDYRNAVQLLKSRDFAYGGRFSFLMKVPYSY
ncbi:UNVERIFIED_CONTAM: hypothetical protein HDU68_010111 [Siphonaria sp. JEL0065]|nr:hypothetical protein HDU68_010111 [Siphonaria sp. JEL0065]